jgi:hypothetical protein
VGFLIEPATGIDVVSFDEETPYRVEGKYSGCCTRRLRVPDFVFDIFMQVLDYGAVEVP